MKKTLKFFVFLGVLLLAGGVIGYRQFILADYTYTFDGKRIADVFEGNISFTGHDNHVTIKEGSQVGLITILGDRNVVRIEEQAEVEQVRVLAGRDNTVIAPEDMVLEMTGVLGRDNTRRSDTPPSLEGL